MLRRLAKAITATAALLANFARQLPPTPIRISPLVGVVLGLSVACQDRQERIQEITKQELVQLLHESPPLEMVVILYDRFLKLKEDEFREELQLLISQCRTAKIRNIYMIDEKEANYLYQIVDMLKNTKHPNHPHPNEQPLQVQGKKGFQVFFKSQQYPQAFELGNNRERQISEQIKQIRRFEITTNSSSLLEELNTHFANPFTFNSSIVVKQCPAEGECVDAYRREVKSLIDSGMLAQKADEFKFHLVVDHPQGILGAPSDYMKSFNKTNQKLHGKPIGSTRKQDTFIYRRDYLGNEISCWSDWLERIGHSYDPLDRFMMFIHPRIHYISKRNTMADLLWYLRVARNNNECSISLNNTKKWTDSNTPASLEVFQMLHAYHPRLKYLIVSSEKTSELIKHMNADSKYVLFKQDSNKIWKKEFLDLDSLESIKDKKERDAEYIDRFKSKVDEFVAHPTYRDMVEANKELEINLDKLRSLKLRQQAKIQAKKEYVIRVCNSNCYKNLSNQLIQQVRRKMGQPVNVYWIDSTTQNVGVEEGSYLLKEGRLVNLASYLDGI